MTQAEVRNAKVRKLTFLKGVILVWKVGCEDMGMFKKRSGLGVTFSASLAGVCHSFFFSFFLPDAWLFPLFFFSSYVLAQGLLLFDYDKWTPEKIFKVQVQLFLSCLKHLNCSNLFDFFSKFRNSLWILMQWFYKQVQICTLEPGENPKIDKCDVLI